MKRKHAVILALVVLYASSLGVSAAMAPAAPSEKIGTADGPTLVTASGRPAPGVVERYHANGTRDWRLAKWRAAMGTQRLNDGRILVAYQNDTDACDLYQKCHRTGVQLWTPPPEARLTWEWSMETRAGLAREIHDANYHADTDTISLVDMEYERLVVIDRATKDIEWQWNASEHYTAPPDPTKRDWLHINDADRIAPGRYIVSVRNANQLLIVERDRGVVEVINEATDADPHAPCRGFDDDQLYGADPRCGGTDVLNKQHDPQWLDDGRVLVADSVNDRVVELQREGDHWVVAWSVSEVAGVDFYWPRDANRLRNGHTLIADVRANRVVEIDEDGELIYQIPQNEELYNALRDGTEYPAGEAYNADANPGVRPPKPPLQNVVRGLRYAGVAPLWFSGWHLSLGLVLAVVLAGEGLLSVRARFNL